MKINHITFLNSIQKKANSLTRHFVHLTTLYLKWKKTISISLPERTMEILGVLKIFSIQKKFFRFLLITMAIFLNKVRVRKDSFPFSSLDRLLHRAKTFQFLLDSARSMCYTVYTVKGTMVNL